MSESFQPVRMSDSREFRRLCFRHRRLVARMYSRVPDRPPRLRLRDQRALRAIRERLDEIEMAAMAEGRRRAQAYARAARRAASTQPTADSGDEEE